ncbi:class I SAM-dependent methyltransferase [Moheibacter sediminis]|uniref:Methyltransferase domain-containing protein n=1 Tax=Moheibacter sediminis TaxID=1434700 RepID=A0A1W1YGK3_9FLAO|nr:class I SAM-dependent methyltransferase [Moheibacter sediminis]SMC35264.1 Methyltransferase domain-containing protein [Moheibacter sediminis]
MRENAECPTCGSLERTRLLLFYLQNETDLFSRECSLLHIAPEDSLKKIFKKSKNINYINGDLNPNYADEIIDITDIKYPENYFDFIICAHVLGHVPDEAEAIREMFRVLKPNGLAFVLTLINKNDIPTYEDPSLQTENERLQAYGEKDLVRLHGNDFAERLSREGFKVETINYTQELEKEIIQKFQLKQGVRETIFKSLKN